VLFSSRHTTGSPSQCGRAYSASNSYKRCRYCAVSAPMHHISRRQGLRQFFLAVDESSRG
jgi:hypothetical protein